MMAKYYYLSRPTRWSVRSHAEEEDDGETDSEWADKARALQVRRWRALKRAQRKTFRQRTRDLWL